VGRHEMLRGRITTEMSYDLLYDALG
jgi:hypothetical protein